MLRSRGAEVSPDSPHIFAPSADGWFHTGDLGPFDENGYLDLTGRKGDRIIRGGENVDRLEVEQVLIQHPAVSDVAIVGTHQSAGRVVGDHRGVVHVEEFEAVEQQPSQRGG